MYPALHPIRMFLVYWTLPTGAKGLLDSCMTRESAEQRASTFETDLGYECVFIEESVL